jgi:homospermidine synthase
VNEFVNTWSVEGFRGEGTTTAEMGRLRLQAPTAHPHHDRRNHQRGCGSDLDIEDSRRLVPHQNATTMQVAISVVAACMWMLENPCRGLCLPDDLPHDYVLNVSKLYLGKFISISSDWNPLKHYSKSSTATTSPNSTCPTRGSSRIF